jgi:hypothetical protein
MKGANELLFSERVALKNNDISQEKQKTERCDPFGAESIS